MNIYVYLNKDGRMHKILFVFFFAFPLFSFSQLSLIELEKRSVPEPFTIDSTVYNWNVSQPNYNNLPQEAKQSLYWTNYCRNNPKKFWDSVVVPVLGVFAPLNKQEARSLRAELGSTGHLNMFSLNDNLIRTAQLHASDIAKKKSPPSHNSTNGTDFGTRMKMAGIKACANENISLSSQSVLLSIVLLYLDIDLPGLGHRKALMDPILREIGVGSAIYGQDQYFLVQDLACRQ
jgi:hypothetical protein